MTISLARDLEMSSAICCGVVSNDFAICVLPSGNVTVMSSRGLSKVSHLHNLEGMEMYLQSQLGTLPNVHQRF